MATVVYIKGDQNVEVTKAKVTMTDVVSMECSDSCVLAKIKTLPVLRMSEQTSQRQVISVLELIQKIHQEYPNAEVQNLGAADIIVTYEKPRKKNLVLQAGKVAIVVLIVFVGAAFSIMTFNNDVNLTTLFGQIYELVMGKQHNGYGVLEISYSLGVILGVLLFFNHFGKKKFTVDPTPMEVEMRLYENDIQTTLIENASRNGSEKDVD